MVKKRPRVTDEQVGEMLRLKREGKTDTAIGKLLGIHRQTVHRYLKRRRNDILADEARKQVLIDELRGHFQLLANFADNLKWRFGASPSEGQWIRDPVRGALTPNRALTGMAGSTFLAGDIGIPGSGGACWVGAEWKRMYSTSPTDEHFIQALREHTKGSSLWLQWDRWQEGVADYATASRSLFSWVKDRAETELLQKTEPEYLEPIEEWLMGDILRETNRLAGEELEIKRADLVTPEDRLLARARSNSDAQALKEELVRIREQARQLPEWTEVQRATPKVKGGQQELRHIVAEIGSALDGIKLMGAFRGRCHLCPI
jgi:hypothetical protein